MIRRACADDVPALVEVRSALALTRAGSGGGFLLGTDAAGYAERVRDGLTWVIEADGRVVGLAIVLPDALFRGSDVWARRDAVRWERDVSQVVDDPLAYFDQLAVLPYHRRGAAPLALVAVLDALAGGAHHLLATTVAAPLTNLAAVPFLERMGLRRAGRIDEHYPGVGALVSDIWLGSRADLEARIAAPRTPAESWVLHQAREVLDG